MAIDTKLVPLAMLDQGGTLCTTPGQDQYFIVQTSGVKEKIDLPAACKCYLSATRVVWGKRGKAAPKEGVSLSKERSTEKWRKKMREALGNIEDPPKK
jgi:Tfp pilus assembly protein PilZ